MIRTALIALLMAMTVAVGLYFGTTSQNIFAAFAGFLIASSAAVVAFRRQIIRYAAF